MKQSDKIRMQLNLVNQGKFAVLCAVLKHSGISSEAFTCIDVFLKHCNDSFIVTISIYGNSLNVGKDFS